MSNTDECCGDFRAGLGFCPTGCPEMGKAIEDMLTIGNGAVLVGGSGGVSHVGRAVYSAEPKPRLIALGGLKGSGKTTASDHLVNNHNFIRVKMAGGIKEMLRALLVYAGVPTEDVPNYLEGRFKEQMSGVLDGNTPRHAMQSLGAEWGREQMGEDFWVNITYSRITKLLSEGRSVVVDDVRYPNELEMLKELQARAVWVQRREVTVRSVHSSEVSLNRDDFDSVIYNDFSRNDLYEDIDEELFQIQKGRS